MKQPGIESTLWNGNALLSTLWSTVQQLVVAASTYFIMQTLKLATQEDFSGALTYSGLFVMSLILVYLPNTLSIIYLQKWRLSSTALFFDAFIQKNKGRVAQGHKSQKSLAESWLTNESLTVYDQVTDLLYQLYSTLTNALFSVVVIALVLDLRILAWYLIAGLVLVSANLLFKSQITRVSLETQAARKNLSNTLLLAWDNIFIGNKHNFEIWNRRFRLDLKNSSRAQVEYDLVRALISSGTVSVALLIVAAGNGLFLVENQNSLPMIAGLFATFPRQLQIIQSIFAFFNLALAWTGTYQQLKELGLMVEGKNIETIQFIQPEKIEMTRAGNSLVYQETSEILTRLESLAPGRWTLRGRNGVGKSTLLSVMKEKMGEAAFLLPSHYAELCFRSPLTDQSDGNQLLTAFKEILELENVKYVLLDEWDANLDGENLQKMNLVIEALASVKVVVESRHRQDLVAI